ncbi:MAG: FIST domain protein [Sandaracinaceae bacterium]|nr:MAG: FIST domain protein [Sandaracinaceae bacterium]
MLETAAAYTRQVDGAAAGRELGEALRRELGEDLHAVVVFASSRFDHEALLAALHDAASPKILIGASSAGEFTQAEHGEGTACALAIRSDHLRFSSGLGRRVSEDPTRAAREVVDGFVGVDAPEYPHRAALVMTDALAGHSDNLVEQLTVMTGARYEFAGGGAGDDAQFKRTHVFCGTEVCTDAVVALEILSEKPLGVGVGHGWRPASRPFRVTKVEGKRLVSLNGLPAIEVFEEHAASSGQALDRADPLPFFLHNILGVETEEGHRLRVPLSVGDDGAVACAAEIPEGARVRIMSATNDSAVEAAGNAARSAVQALGVEKPGAAVFFDCVATRLRMGDVFGFELDRVAEALGEARFVGCNTYGQIARGAGQFGGFHNCTAVVFVFPR